MNRSSVSLPLAAVTALLFAQGCIFGSKKTTDSKGKYSVMPREDLPGLLLQYLKTNRSPNFCIIVKATNAENEKIIADRFQTGIASSLGKWIAAAAQHPSWPDKEKSVEARFALKPDGSACPSDSVAKFFGFERKADFEQNCWQPGPRCRSFAQRDWNPDSPLTGSIYLQPGHEKGDYVIGHEIGHLLGLGDTYKEQGYISGGGDQPASTMNGQSPDWSGEAGAMVITGDDMQGLHAILDALSGRPNICRTGFIDDTANVTSVFRDSYCIVDEKHLKAKMRVYFVGTEPVTIYEQIRREGEPWELRPICKLPRGTKLKIIPGEAELMHLEIPAGLCRDNQGKEFLEGWTQHDVAFYPPNTRDYTIVTLGLTAAPVSSTQGLDDAICTVANDVAVQQKAMNGEAVQIHFPNGGCKGPNGEEIQDGWVQRWWVEVENPYDKPISLGAIECPEGYYVATVGSYGGRYCTNDKDALGPFTRTMVAECERWGGGPGCQNPMWSKDFYVGIRGSGPCPVGARIDSGTGYCVEGNDAFGPFPRKLANACVAQGQDASICNSARWNKVFLADMQKAAEGNEGQNTPAPTAEPTAQPTAVRTPIPSTPTPVGDCREAPVEKLKTVGSIFTLRHGPSSSPEKYTASLQVISGEPRRFEQFDRKFAVTHSPTDKSNLAFRVEPATGTGIVGKRYNLVWAPGATVDVEFSWKCTRWEGTMTYQNGTKEVARISAQ